MEEKVNIAKEKGIADAILVGNEKKSDKSLQKEKLI